MTVLRRFFANRRDSNTPRIAAIAQNERPSAKAILRALDVGSQIVRTVCDRRKIISADDRIDPKFAMAASNWEKAPDSDYVKSYRLLSALKWEDVRFLRLRTQSFTGNSLIFMERTSPGSAHIEADSPIPNGFEENWGHQLRKRVLEHWRALTMGRQQILRAPNVLGETGWWVDGSIVNVDTIDFQERLNLIDMAGIIDRFSGQRPRVLEIGGGYGSLCQALRQILRPSQYVICDLPESLLFSGLYLSFADDLAVRVATGSNTFEAQNGSEIQLLPNYLAQPTLTSQTFDLVINTLSMSEMSEHQVKTYGAMISKAIGTAGLFFEQNHDNRHLGLIDCREHLSSFFKTKTIVDPRDMPTTRGIAVLWSNYP